jgi:hypothetical protein
MLISSYETLLPLLALVGSSGLSALGLAIALQRRERLLPVAVTLQSQDSRRARPDGLAVRPIGHRACATVASQSWCVERTRRPTTHEHEQPSDKGLFMECRDSDLEYLDPVDRASALSFPASDPPAIAGPTRAALPGIPPRDAPASRHQP